MELIRVIALPSCRMISSGADASCDFSEAGLLGRFDRFFTEFSKNQINRFSPLDFLYFDEEKGGLVWNYVLEEGRTAPEGWDVVDFQGGLYAVYDAIDNDPETNGAEHKALMEKIDKTPQLELDVRPDRPIMGHIISPPEVITAMGAGVMETFVPVRLKVKGQADL